MLGRVFTPFGVKNYAAVARALGLSRARITQVMNLMLLPIPEQERLLGIEPREGSFTIRKAAASEP